MLLYIFCKLDFEIITVIILFVSELASEAKEAFREFLRIAYPGPEEDNERFFNEWKMTYKSDGPFNTENDLSLVSAKMTKPDDFMV